MENPDELVLIMETKAPLSRFPKVPMILKDHPDYDNYFAPKRVSIGPIHHYDKPNLKDTQSLKHAYARDLLQHDYLRITHLFDILLERVQELRGFYEEEEDTRRFSDHEFTWMMLLDGCYLIYVFFFFYYCSGVREDAICDVHDDFLLLENQIPFQVMVEVMRFVGTSNYLLPLNWFCTPTGTLASNVVMSRSMLPPPTTNHVLELLQTRVTEQKFWSKKVGHIFTSSCNVRELKRKWISIRPNSSGSLAEITVVERWFGSSYLELPPISVAKPTKHLLLNLVALEMSSGPSWITMYLCLLRNMIHHSEDVAILRAAGVITNLLGSDQEVVDLFKEIGKYLTPCLFANFEGEPVIHKHYGSNGDSNLKLKSD